MNSVTFTHTKKQAQNLSQKTQISICRGCVRREERIRRTECLNHQLAKLCDQQAYELEFLRVFNGVEV